MRPTLILFATAMAFRKASGQGIYNAPGTNKSGEQKIRPRRLEKFQFPGAWDDYRFTRMLFKPHNLSVEDVYQGFAWFKLKFYSRPVKIRRYLKTLLDTKDIATALMAYQLNNAYEVAFRSSEIFDDYVKKDLARKFDGRPNLS